MRGETGYPDAKYSVGFRILGTGVRWKKLKENAAIYKYMNIWDSDTHIFIGRVPCKRRKNKKNILNIFSLQPSPSALRRRVL